MICPTKEILLLFCNMDVILTEILEHIFENMTTLKDLINCSNTCKRWNQVIKRKYMNRTKLLVASGFPIPSGVNIEILDLIDPNFKCIFIDKRAKRGGEAIGGMLKNQALIVGGSVLAPKGPYKNYIILGNNHCSNNDEYMKTFVQRPNGDAGVVLNKDTFWITGNETTEFIKLNKPPLHLKGPKLPFRSHSHSMIQIDSNTVYIIGGIQNGSKSKKTWIIKNPMEKLEIKEGPSLNEFRSPCSCAKMKINGRLFIVAAGGSLAWGGQSHHDHPSSNEDSMNSVELLDTSSSGQSWKMGPKMPYAINGPSMITSPTEKGVLIISGMKSEVYPNKSGSVSRLSKMTPDIFELSGDCFNTLKWSKLDHKLQYPRFRHLSFLISNELFVKLGRNYSS